MRPTSPREIMPTPTRTDSFVVKPVSLANTPHPIALVAIATVMRATLKSARSPRSRPFASSPMLMKKIGTNIE